MRKEIRHRVRRRSRGIDLALDLNADIAVNLNQSGKPVAPSADKRQTAGDDAVRDTRIAGKPKQRD